MNYKKSEKDNFYLEKDNLIIGIRPISEALEAGVQMDKIFIQKDTKGELISELKKKIRRLGFYYQDVPLEKLNRLSRKNHQGAIAFSSPISFYNLGDTLDELFTKGIEPSILVLDRISDVRNFGAIVRTGEAMGINIIIIPSKGAAQINEETIKTSAGAIFNIKICKEYDLSNTLLFLTSSGIEVIGISEKGKEKISDFKKEGPTALILGSEEDGISSELWKICQRTYKIPLQGHTKSLNVSVAAGIAVYEVFKNTL